jgi:glyoxylase-like metal-dependent hydrolase (beta-lactamase superfamily II)
MEGQVLRIGGRDWRCWVGHGHSPEHISLHCEALDLMISGDMVLPRISTNISVIDLEPEGNPLPLYLESLQRLRVLPASTLVLPSHGKPFTGLHARIDQLLAHHEERLAEVMATCAEAPASAADVLPVMFKRELDLHQTTFAMGEVVAHLNALWLDGRLQRRRDAAGVWRFSPA